MIRAARLLPSLTALVVLAVMGALTSLGGRAYAQEGVPAAKAADAGAPPVVLEMTACPQAWPRQVRRIVALELGRLLVGAEQPPPAGSDRVRMTCEGELVRIEARESGNGAPVSRVLRPDEFPGDASPRALALVAIEVLAALNRQRLQAREEAAAPRAAEVSPKVAVVAAPARAPVSMRAPVSGPPALAAPSPRTSSGLALSALGRQFLAPHGLAVWGGRVDLDRELGSRWDLGLDLEVAASPTRTDALGSARGQMVSGGVFAGVRGGRGWLSGVLAVGGRVGLLRLTGDPSAANARGSDVLHPWGGPAIVARAAAVRGRFGVVLAVEAGFVVGGARGVGATSTVLAVEGGWVALSFGAALRRRT